jgi:hypothetical protein
MEYSLHTKGDSHVLTEQDSPKAAFAAKAAAAAAAAASAAAASSSSPVPKISARFQYTTPPKIEQSSITITRIIMTDILYYIQQLFFIPIV